MKKREKIYDLTHLFNQIKIDEFFDQLDYEIFGIVDVKKLKEIFDTEWIKN